MRCYSVAVWEDVVYRLQRAKGMGCFTTAFLPKLDAWDKLFWKRQGWEKEAETCLIN